MQFKQALYQRQWQGRGIRKEKKRRSHDGSEKGFVGWESEEVFRKDLHNRTKKTCKNRDAVEASRELGYRATSKWEIVDVEKKKGTGC
jgi:hypothetical protein